MNSFYLACIVGFSLSVTVGAQDRCAGQLIGRWNPHAISCHSFTYCFNETELTVACENGQVFERNSLVCKNSADANTACGTIPDCAGKPDGYSGDTIPNCQTFHLCKGGTYIVNSRQYCPASTVWDPVNGYCNHVVNVPPPCGTAPSP